MLTQRLTLFYFYLNSCRRTSIALKNNDMRPSSVPQVFVLQQNYHIIRIRRIESPNTLKYIAVFFMFVWKHISLTSKKFWILFLPMKREGILIFSDYDTNRYSELWRWYCFSIDIESKWKKVVIKSHQNFYANRFFCWEMPWHVEAIIF